MITEAVIRHKFDHNCDILTTSQRMSGEVVESLILPLGNTVLDRVINPDGSYGEIRIHTQEFRDPLHLSISDIQYKIVDGKIVTDTAYHTGKAEKIHPYRKLKLLAKVALSHSS
jgi:hypothetical protein